MLEIAKLCADTLTPSALESDSPTLQFTVCCHGLNVTSYVHIVKLNIQCKGGISIKRS